MSQAAASDVDSTAPHTAKVGLFTLIATVVGAMFAPTLTSGLPLVPYLPAAASVTGAAVGLLALVAGWISL
ncbi:hypothetical protein ABZ784_09205 [Streptomyces tendae]|uniref:hypothetical protein n=1 Tax=Streptomyces TaxID=1883 RepID=UPI0033EB3345